MKHKNTLTIGASDGDCTAVAVRNNNFKDGIEIIFLNDYLERELFYFPEFEGNLDKLAILAINELRKEWNESVNINDQDIADKVNELVCQRILEFFANE